MRLTTTLAALVLVSTGCTSLSLERHTLSQVSRLTDVRFQEVMDNLAVIASTPAILPAYAAIAEGTAQVNDTVMLDAKALWQRMTFRGFASETIGVVGTRSPQPSWTVDPVAQHQQIETMYYAFKWVVCGRPAPESPAEKLLKAFQVYSDLDRLPDCWLHVGSWREVPHNALYVAHSSNRWIWVTPEGMEGLSSFSLIIQDIATVDIDSLGRDAPAGLVKIKYTGPKPAADDSRPEAASVEAKAAKKGNQDAVIVQTIKGKLTEKVVTFHMPPDLMERDVTFQLQLPGYKAQELREAGGGLELVPLAQPPALNPTPSFIGRQSK